MSGLFDETNGEMGFEAQSMTNGFTYWYASDLAHFLGYENWKSFEGVIERAIAACMKCGVPLLETIVQDQKIVDGKAKKDYKLSRFGCYLATMVADSKKPAVAKAKVYFAQMADAVRAYVEQAEQVERAAIRHELGDQEKSLGSVAHLAGVENYAFFQNAGYRGLYNMNLTDLKERKGIPANRSLLDFMGKREMAANLFRITETEARIKQNNIRGQKPLETTAENVGKEVRGIMVSQSGTKPEDLPAAEDLKDVLKQLKKDGKKINQLEPPQQD